MLNNKIRTDMKKKYSRPRIEEMTFSTESILVGSKAAGVSGMEGVTVSTDRPVSFSKKHEDIWDFEDED